MAERIIEVEAGSLEEARKQAESQVPEGLRVVSEMILSDGKPKSIMGVADTIGAAFEEAENKLPSGVEVVDRQQIQKPMRRAVTVEAADEQSARTQVEQGIAKNARVEEVTLKKLGKKGVFGMGRKPNLYEVQVFEQAAVEIKYKKKAKIRVKLRESPETWFQKLEKKDYRALISLKIIEKSDPRFSQKLYDKGHDLYLTPLEFDNPYGGAVSLDEPLDDLQSTAQEILKFWKKPKLSYSRNLEKKYELGQDELRIQRIETFGDFSVSEEIMYIVRLGENAFFSWVHRAR
jgi:hypothetical protein